MKLEDVLRGLRERGLRLTRQRREIVRILYERLARGGHPTLDEIYREAKERMPRISLGTVYSTLKVLEKLGYIVAFQIGGKTHIDRSGLHVNIICEDSGEIREIADQELVNAFTKEGAKPLSIVVRARCQ
ncbi:MAG: Fur family transcriptional regulator [Pyrobaculum sp.]|uniref:Fur family transcriptional regulator n=1 Tax=Pyrobaculum sp. TaxID=2004705 RepID=UPI003CB49825